MSLILLIERGINVLFVLVKELGQTRD